METFSDVRNYLNSIPNIHRGGCGIATISMYRWLKKNQSVRGIRFIFLDTYSNYSYNNNKRYFETKKGSPVACSHVGLFMKGKAIDCEEELNLVKYPFNIKTTDEKALIIAINKIYDWNERFKRNYIKNIAKKLDIDLSDILIN
jgi:hypothetical protein